MSPGWDDIGHQAHRAPIPRYELVIVRVKHVSAAGVKGRVRVRIPVLHVTLDVDKRLRYGLEIDLELAVAQAMDLVAQCVIAAPEALERENDLLVTTVFACFAKFLHLVSEQVGSNELLATGASGARLIAGTCGERLDALLEPVSRSSRSGMRRLTASDQDDRQP